MAIDAGYRHFDTAFMYNNEADVGTAVQAKITEGTVSRDDLYIVTKVCISYFLYEIIQF